MPQTMAARGHPNLNKVEQKQLGTTRLLLDGTPSLHPWPTKTEWKTIREHLVARSQKSNPNLDLTLTAYTPGETAELLENPRIKTWHKEQSGHIEGYGKLILVPCAKTKPWEGPSINRSRLYSAYNQLRGEHPDWLFVTISEPLGVVPMNRWSDFLQYDNPGLFTDDAQRSGMMHKDWIDTFGKVYGTPYDPQARSNCLETLGDVVGKFLANNQDKQIYSFVDNLESGKSTHGIMLDHATADLDIEVKRYSKRGQARTSPYTWIVEKVH